MKIENYIKILNNLSPNDRVLDVGGWERPFNRSDVVIDIMPFSTRKIHNAFPKEMDERFTGEKWINKDFTEGLPFKDKEFDFVLCGHVLEDIKDPVFLCKELIRVAKAGYIEFPNRAYEMKASVDGLPNSHSYVGYNHHRWLAEQRGNKLFFIQKRCMYSVMKILRCKKVTNRFTGFFWEKSFDYEELFFNSYDELMREALLFRSKNDNIPFNKLWKKYLFIKYPMKLRAKMNTWYTNLFIQD